MFPIARTAQDDFSSPATPIIPIRALLLDDNRFDQRRIERMARDSGLMISIDVAANLADMTAYLDTQNYDVAFLDYRLPIGSGQDALVLLRDHQNNASCATIMVAGDEQLDQSAQTMRDACDTFISKDQLSPDILRSSITAILSDRALDMRDDTSPEMAKNTGIALEVETEIEGVIRDLRNLRASHSANSQALKAALSKLEMQSIKIWSDVRTHGALVSEQDAKFSILARHPIKPVRAN